MDGARSNNRQATSQQHRRPAIGMDAVTNNVGIDAIVDTVQRVGQHDAPVFVAVPSDAPTLHRKLRDTAATIVDIPTTDADVAQAFETAGKKHANHSTQTVRAHKGGSPPAAVMPTTVTTHCYACKCASKVIACTGGSPPAAVMLTTVWSPHTAIQASVQAK